MCSRTSARRDRRSAMMFDYIDYADTAVRTRNRQRAGGEGTGREGEREHEELGRERRRERWRQTNTDRKRGERWERAQRNGASVSMRGRT